MFYIVFLFQIIVYGRTRAVRLQRRAAFKYIITFVLWYYSTHIINLLKATEGISYICVQIFSWTTILAI